MKILKRGLALFLTAVLAVTTLISPVESNAATAQTVTVDISKTHQSIRGFGGINHPEWTGLDLTDAQRKKAFGNGEDELGLTVLRVFVNPDSSQWSKAIPTAKYAYENGVTVFASPWEPPASLAESGGSNGKLHIPAENYGAYAEHLNNFGLFMKQNGVDLYSISVQNEPDYASEWTYWSTDEATTFIAEYGDKITSTRLMSPESFQYAPLTASWVSDGGKKFYTKILNNAKAMENCDLFGTHFYGTQRAWMDFPELENSGKEIWMTEVYVPNSEADSANRWPEALDVAENIHNGLVVGNMSAYVWWYIRRSYGLMTEDGNISKRGYCMAQYSKWIRPGYVRIDATEQPASDVYVSAYKGDDKVVIVAINKGTEGYAQNFQLSGSNIANVDRYRTSANENLAETKNLTVTGDSFYAQLPSNSVSTFVITLDDNQGSQTDTSATLLNTYGKVFGYSGTCINVSELKDSSMLTFLKKHYNSITLENEMKPDTILKTWSKELITVAQAKELGYYIPDNYTDTYVPKLNFDAVDQALKICCDNGLKMRAHTLVWHSQTPTFFFRTNYDASGSYVSSSVMDARMEFYIRTVMNHVYDSQYGKDVVYAWDVVNEYLNARTESSSDWVKVYGEQGTSPDFVKKAFTIASDVLNNYGLKDKVSLFYNDYNTYMNADDVVSLINYINKDGKVCNGIGMQSHLGTDFPSPDYYKSALTKFKNAGFEIQITELDVANLNNLDQPQYYYDIASAILSTKKNGGNITGFTLWGMWDSLSWITKMEGKENTTPLLFTGIDQPKEDYYKVIQAYTDAGYTIGSIIIDDTGYTKVDLSTATAGTYDSASMKLTLSDVLATRITLPSTVKAGQSASVILNVTNTGSTGFRGWLTTASESSLSEQFLSSEADLSGDVLITFTATQDCDYLLLKGPDYQTNIDSLTVNYIKIKVDTTTEADVTSSYFNHFTGKKNNNSLYTITGSYSDTKGTITYAGTSYSACLKMETATNVSFSTTSAGTLTLVFAEANNSGAAYVDGTKYASDANGVVTVDLAAGSHTITKANSTNLFIINFESSGSTENVEDADVVTSIDVSSTVTSSKSIKEQTENDVYQVRDVICSFDDSSINRATSEHFQIIWGNGDTTGTVTYDFIVGNLINLENIRSFYINELGMKDIGISQNKSISGYYKTNVYVSGTGLSEFEDDWAYMAVDSQSFAYLFLAPGAMRVDEPSWVVPHELAHAFTYHQGGSIEYAWYEATANWFRDQYLGSKYYAYGGNTYGPTSDFFAPYMINSSYYVPHMLNWYDTWPIFLYISENPDNIDGLGMELMHKIFEHDGSNESMYDTIQNLSGVSIKTILGGMSRRLATMDFSRQEHYLNRLNNDTLTVSGNYEKIYTTLNSADSDGWQSVPSDRAPMQTGFNIIPLDIDLTKNKITVEFVNTSSESGSDFRTSIVTSTKNNLTRYSNMLAGDGTAEIQLNGDETKAYLVICATPDAIERFEVDWNSSAEDESTRFSYKVRITASDDEDDNGSSETTPSVTISFDATTLTADNGSSVTATTFGNGYIKVTGALVYKTAKDSAGNVTNNVTGIAVPNSAAAGFTVKVNGTATLVVTASSSGSAKTSSISVVSAEGTAVAEKNGETSVTGGSSAKKDFTYELTTGEYTVVCPTDSTTTELRVIGINGTGNFVAYEASSEPEPEADADYTAVNEALAKVPSDLSIYTDETAQAVTDAVNAVVTGKKASQQAEVDAMAQAIEDAIAGLVEKFIRNGIYSGGDGNFYYYENDVVVTSYTGLKYNANDDSWWLVQSGKVAADYTGFFENGAGKWYVVTGKIDITFTGLALEDGKWLCVKNGKYYPDYTGMVKNGGSWWYVVNGELDTSYSGLFTNDGGTWFIKNGKIVTDSTGILTANGQFYYVVAGKAMVDYTGLVQNNGAFWYIENGIINTTATTVTIDGVTYTLSNGKVTGQ